MRPRTRNLVKRAIAGVYSYAADRIYEPVVVRGAFPLLGGDVNERVLRQGRRAVAIARDRPILDMPVGTAYFTIETARAHRGVVVGADIAPGMVAEARRAADEAGVENLVTVQADAHHLPFADESFGAIMCTNGLQVIPGLRRTITELRRVLHPEGALFVSTFTVPLGALVSERTADRLPTLLKSKQDLANALRSVGLDPISLERRRLGLLIEARPGFGRPTAKITV